MCAVSGMIGLSEKIKNPLEIFQMMNMQKHRGMDDSGVAAFNWCEDGKTVVTEEADFYGRDHDFDGVFGFNRLSIQDLSLAGHQPMLDRTGRVVLIFNGEIYNAVHLKKELLMDGYRFCSHTDTEVILALFLKYGFEQMLGMLNGMFSMAIADLRKQTCYFARDRFGIKPFYYTVQEGIFYFSSEMKAILSLKGFEARLDRFALAECINFRATYGRTMFSGIKCLMSGEMLILNANGIESKKYFELNHYNRRTDDKRSSYEVEQELEHLLKNSVKLQLAGDVPVGCQLSGGIDSSLVAWIAAGLKKEPLQAVSIVFKDHRFTEETYMNMVKEKVLLRQDKYLFTEKEFLAMLEMAVWHNESMLTHPNTVCLMWLMSRAKERLTVLLSGEGADELFGGYKRFAIKSGQRPSAEAYVRATTTIPAHLRHKVFPDLSDDKVLEERIALFESLSGTGFDKQVKYELLTYLPELLLRQDKSAMAFSIENRVPFLDHDMVNFGFGLTQKQLLHDVDVGKNLLKYPLKCLAANVFGNSFAYRDKMGFSVPTQNFIKNRKFREYFYDQIAFGASQRGIINTSAFITLYEKISEKEYDFQELECFWRGLTLEILCELYCDGRKYICIV